MITRRGLLAGILAAGAAPAIVTNPMRIWVPRPVEESWGVRLPLYDPDMVDLQEALNRQMRRALDNINLACNPPIVVGVDLARPGGDLTAWAVRRAGRIEALRVLK